MLKDGLINDTKSLDIKSHYGLHIYKEETNTAHANIQKEETSNETKYTDVRDGLFNEDKSLDINITGIKSHECKSTITDEKYAAHDSNIQKEENNNETKYNSDDSVEFFDLDQSEDEIPVSDFISNNKEKVDII